MKIFILIFFLPILLNAGIRVGNQDRTYSDAYRQVLELQNSNVKEESNLPVIIEDKKVFEDIKNKKSNIDIKTLNSCASIYDNGKFMWGKPDSGTKKNVSDGCVAIVEMRKIDGNKDIVLASMKLSAGDSVKCNISDFPQSGYTIDAGKIVFPADKEPSLEEVEKVMDEEQKQHAVFKIVAGGLVGGIMGNIAGKGDASNNKLFGANKEKITGSVIGGITGAGIMTANSYTGKRMGDTLLGVGVNSVAGGIVGNMVASNNEILKIEDCEHNNYKTKCLKGLVYKGAEIETKEGIAYYYNISNKNTIKVSETNNSCIQTKVNLFNIKINNQYLEAITSFDKIEKYSVNEKNSCLDNESGGEWVKIDNASVIQSKIRASIPDFKDKAFGLTYIDWNNWKQKNLNSVVIAEDNKEYKIEDFYPFFTKAEDGEVIDFNNKSRLKSTITGASMGAGLGALSSYQGADQAIQERWVNAVREYKDSLQKIYCATGTRFLSSYNEVFVIPNM